MLSLRWRSPSSSSPSDVVLDLNLDLTEDKSEAEPRQVTKARGAERPVRAIFLLSGLATLRLQDPGFGVQRASRHNHTRRTAQEAARVGISHDADVRRRCGCPGVAQPAALLTLELLQMKCRPSCSTLVPTRPGQGQRSPPAHRV